MPSSLQHRDHDITVARDDQSSWAWSHLIQGPVFQAYGNGYESEAHAMAAAMSKIDRRLDGDGDED